MRGVADVLPSRFFVTTLHARFNVPFSFSAARIDLRF
jgi:hypothetical protein